MEGKFTGPPWGPRSGPPPGKPPDALPSRPNRDAPRRA